MYTSNQKPILVVDFDSVLHSYSSGWQGIDVIKDKPVPGAARFLAEAVNVFEVNIFSSRSERVAGIEAMMVYTHIMLVNEFQGDGHDIFEELKWPTTKPPAFVTLDDRAVTFTGIFPKIEDLRNFKPWNKP